MGTQLLTTIKGVMSLTCFSHQLDSKNNGAVLLLKTAIRYDNFFLSSLSRMARDGFKLEKFGLPISSRDLPSKINKKILWSVSLLKFV